MDQILKKPKLEEESNGKKEEYEEQEEALVALIEHRTKEVEHVKQKISYYKSQLEQAERRLNDSQSKLARLRSRDSLTGSRKAIVDSYQIIKEEPKSSSPVRIDENNSGALSSSRPQLIIPAVKPKIAQPVKLAESSIKASVGSGSRVSASLPTQSNGVGKVKEEVSCKASDELEVVEVQAKGTKRKFEQKEHKELIPLIRSYSSPSMVHCQPGVHISSQHKRKLRSLALCPSDDQLFVTSALDGIVNLWQVHSKGAGASLLSSTDCVSTKQRRWPEDITWHPQGGSLFCVYTADAGDSQISILNLNSSQRGKRVTYFEDKPHVKGIINNIVFMPWDDLCFVTGGSDHAVVIWKEKDGENSWKYKPLHRNLHSSAVMGVAGLQQKNIVLSAGADKRIIGFDVMAGRADFKHQIECKCMSVLPNPSDFNLFMVQTGAHERQLRLFDIRLRQTEIHAFGWKQESSESQSALINQAWSPDGLYITSGSADPIIHIFDIRYNSHRPSQSVKAHQKRVFKAVWLNSLPLLVSISSDLNIGLHKVS
ncbi:Transducin family protein / WD-40 repeat family protein [Thalictrum thalictroides]|uniref:Transducin family protein / WD-40 repeat family protein n=1 Tax=Thalictrum thalictroides TaxID=46969 RepID=A0A7J6WH37_THATH|nr:Transducin family protein / WD-40 repeat family protein [Thalictrum thalictroides]